MQAVIPVFTILGVAAGAQLTLVPYAYLTDSLPVYRQSQDTRIGVHAYSYAGGPSAKEEIRGLDGVTRGSYSYVDAHGIPQYVFYVADEGGFRVAATNLPTDGDLPLETGEVLLAKNAHLEVQAKAAAAKEVEAKVEKEERTSRRKRSLEASADDQDRRQPEKPASQGDDRADRESAKAAPESSHEQLPPAAQPEKKKADRSVVTPIYRLLNPLLIPRLTGAATSHLSRVDIYNNVHLKAVRPVESIEILAEPAYEAVILPGAEVPLATSQQSRVQVHSGLRAKVEEKPRKSAEKPEAAALQAIQTPAVATLKYQLEPLPLAATLADYNENRIQLHKSLGLEGPNRKDAVKIDVAQAAAFVTTPIAAVPVEETLPVVAAVSSQSRAQIHGDAKLQVSVAKPTVYLAASYVQPIAAEWPILTPIAQSSQYRSQVHSSEKVVELTE